VYGNRLFMGNIDVSGRTLLYGYLNLAANLSAPTLTGTQNLTMSDGLIDGGAGGLNGLPLGCLEVICNSATATITLPSGAAIAGSVCVIVNRGSQLVTVSAPAPGTINGGATTTVASGAAKMFISLNGNGGLNFWTLG
jgi:hypothetical protein